MSQSPPNSICLKRQHDKFSHNFTSEDIKQGRQKWLSIKCPDKNKETLMNHYKPSCSNQNKIANGEKKMSEKEKEEDIWRSIVKPSSTKTRIKISSFLYIINTLSLCTIVANGSTRSPLIWMSSFISSLSLYLAVGIRMVLIFHKTIILVDNVNLFYAIA